MKQILTAVLVFCAVSAGATEWAANIVYWCQHNGHTEVTNIYDAVTGMELVDGAQEILWRAEITDPPSKAALQAQDQDAVLAWWADFCKTRDADVSEWHDIQRAFAEVLLSEINILREAAGLEPRTMAQFKTAIKAKL